MINLKSSTSLGIAQVLSGSALISLVGIFIKIMVVDYGQPILVVTFWRNLFVCIMLMAGLKIFKPKLFKFERENLGLLSFYGAVLTGLNGIWGWSVYFNGAGVSTVLVYISVPLTVMAQWGAGWRQAHTSYCAFHCILSYGAVPWFADCTVFRILP